MNFYKNIHDQNADVFCISEAGKIAEKKDINLKTRNLTTPFKSSRGADRSLPV
jgi:hypothetical protein